MSTARAILGNFSLLVGERVPSRDFGEWRVKVLAPIVLRGDLSRWWGELAMVIGESRRLAIPAPRCSWIGICAVLVAGCSPAYMSDIYTTSTPRTQSFELRSNDPRPVAILGVVSPPGLLGFAPFLSHALVRAISEAEPPIRVIPTSEIVSIINERDQGLASDYTQLLSGFTASGVLNRKRMSVIGANLNSHYFLLPGVAEFDQTVTDRYDFAGLKLVRNRITTLRLWLQVWDANSGRLLCESTGEITAVTALLTVKRTVPLEEIARRLWLRMIKENLLESKPIRRLRFNVD